MIQDWQVASFLLAMHNIALALGSLAFVVFVGMIVYAFSD